MRLRDYVVSALEFAKAKETELAWIDGILDMSRGKVDTGAMYDAEEGELTEEKARKIQGHTVLLIIVLLDPNLITFQLSKPLGLLVMWKFSEFLLFIVCHALHSYIFNFFP